MRMSHCRATTDKSLYKDFYYSNNRNSIQHLVTTLFFANIKFLAFFPRQYASNNNTYKTYLTVSMSLY